MSPDWSSSTVPVPYADLNNPQSLNLYAYVQNNPITHVDLTGHVMTNLVTADVACYSDDCRAINSLGPPVPSGDAACGGCSNEQDEKLYVQTVNKQNATPAKAANAEANARATRKSGEPAAQQQNQRLKPLAGPPEPGAKPAAIRLASTEIATSSNPITLDDGSTWAGTVYNYQVVDSKGYVIRDDLNIGEILAPTPNTTTMPIAGNWQQIGGSPRRDYVGCRLACPAHDTEVMQNFSVFSIHGTDEPARISSQNRNYIHSDAKGNVTGTSTPVVP